MIKDIGVGIIGLLVILAMIAAVNYIRRMNLFDRNKTLVAVFKSSGGIETDHNVMMNGLKVGKVVSAEAADTDLSAVRVSMKINRNLNIPANSVAHIVQNTLSSPVIVIEKGNSQEFLNDNSIITTREAPGPIESLQLQAKPLANKVHKVLDSLSVSLKKYNSKLNAKKPAELQKQVAAFRVKMARYALSSRQMEAEVRKYISTLQQLTHSPAYHNDSVNNKISGINQKLLELNQLKLADQADSVRWAVSGLSQKIALLNSGKFKSLTTSKHTYDDLYQQLAEVEVLLDDIRTHPKRYLNISVLGKSEKPKQPDTPETIERRRKNAEFNRKQQQQYKL